MPSRYPPSPLLIAALASFVLLSTACLSVRTTRSPIASGASESGGVSVRVYPDDDRRRAGQLGPRFVAGELERRDGKIWVPVFKSLDPAWTVLDLPAGKYRVRFPAVLDEGGNAVRTEDDGHVLRIHDGEMTTVETTLSHFPTGLVVAGAVTAVVAVVLLDDWLVDHHLPVPLPPDPFLAEAIFYLTFGFAESGWEGSALDSAPVITSHFPADGDLAAMTDLRVVFSSSEPLDSTEVNVDAVTVLGEKHGLIAGRTSYDPRRWWVIWEAESGLPRDDTFHVTLAADGVEDLSGHELSEPVTFTFGTTR